MDRLFRGDRIHLSNLGLELLLKDIQRGLCQEEKGLLAGMRLSKASPNAVVGSEE